MIHCRRLCLYVIMSRILTFYLYTMLHVPETSQSFPKLHVHNYLILRRNKYYTYVRLRDLFCILCADGSVYLCTDICSVRMYMYSVSSHARRTSIQYMITPPRTHPVHQHITDHVQRRHSMIWWCYVPCDMMIWWSSFLDQDVIVMEDGWMDRWIT